LASRPSVSGDDEGYGDVINGGGTRVACVESSASVKSRGASAPTSKELPDLVRSALPGHAASQNGATAAMPSVAKMSIADERLDANKFQSRCTPSSSYQTSTSTLIADLTSFPVDNCGAVDLTAATARRILMSLMAQQSHVAGTDISSLSGWSCSAPTSDKRESHCWPEGEVLDLSCKASPAATGVVPLLPPSAANAALHLTDKRREKEQRKRRTSDKKSSSCSPPFVDRPNSTGLLVTSLPSAAGLTRGAETPRSAATSSPAQVDNNRVVIDVDSPLRWGVRDVIEFVSEVPGCQIYAEVVNGRCLDLQYFATKHARAVIHERFELVIVEYKFF
jgi:hypothetical protein